MVQVDEHLPSDKMMMLSGVNGDPATFELLAKPEMTMLPEAKLKLVSL